MNEHADQPAGEPSSNGGIPGKTLQSQREAMGWTVEQVADQLKLAPRQVVALEAGDYASLPSPAVTRGFVRAYAKLLKIDAAPLVSMIEMNQPPQAQAGATMARREQKPAAFSETRFPMGGKRNRLPLGWIAAAMVVIGAGAVAWNFGLLSLTGGQAQGDAAPADGVVLENPAAGVPAAPAANGAAAPANGTAQGPLLNPSVPLISVPAPAAEGSAAPGSVPPAAPAGAAPATTTPSVATPGAITPPAGAPAAAATTPAPVPAAPAAAQAAAGANTLVLNVREDSWIEVRPAKGGRPLVSRLVKAGSTETVEVTEPVNLVVGAPSGVSATLRGAAVALPQQPGKTISRVSLK